MSDIVAIEFERAALELFLKYLNHHEYDRDGMVAHFTLDEYAPGKGTILSSVYTTDGWAEMKEAVLA